jgi:hypothetical protein
MNRLSILSILIAILVFPLLNINAEETRIIEKKNIYGGETVEVTFTREDNYFTKNKIIQYFNPRGGLRKKVVYRKLTTFNDLKIDKITESYTHDGTMQSIEVSIDVDKVRETGIAGTGTYYFPDKSIKRKEVYYGKSDFGNQIYSKSVDYYNLSGAKVRTEFHLSKDESMRSGYSKVVIHYSGGKVLRQEFQ